MISADMSSLRAQDPPQQRISGDERDFVTTAEPLRQPFSAVFGPAEPFWRGELLRRDRLWAMIRTVRDTENIHGVPHGEIRVYHFNLLKSDEI